jgi:flagellar FliL protein
MTDATGDDGTASAPPPKKRGMARLLLFILLPILLLVGGGGAGLYFSGYLDSMLGKPPADADAKPDKTPHEVVFYDLTDDMLVNLNTGGKKTSFLKMAVSLQLENKDDQPKVEAVKPRIIDTFQTYLRELRPEDLRGSAGLYRLREELLIRVNNAVAPTKVDDVLFREMLVQ